MDAACTAAGTIAFPGPAIGRMPCDACGLRALCFPPAAEGALVPRVRTVRRGALLFRRGEPFREIAAPRVGFFRTRVLVPPLRELVTGFQMAGDLIGVEGADTGAYACDVVALEDAQVCVLDFAAAVDLCSDSAGVLRQFQRATAAVMERQLALIALLAHPVPAERRLAAFLHDWLLRLRRVGLAGREGREMLLRMRRAEIASLLGLSLETVSRCFTRLQAEGLIEAENRHVIVLDEPGLARLAGRSGTPS